MKILIVYDSKFGNNQQIANFIAEKFRNSSHEVKVHSAKEVSSKDAVTFQPEIFLFGGPNRAGMVSFTIKHWVSGFASRLQKQGITVNKAAGWSTHLADAADTPERFSWKNIVAKWDKLEAQVPAAKSLPGVMDVIVQDMKGPLEPDWQAKVTDFMERVTNL